MATLSMHLFGDVTCDYLWEDLLLWTCQALRKCSSMTSSTGKVPLNVRPVELLLPPQMPSHLSPAPSVGYLAMFLANRVIACVGWLSFLSIGPPRFRR